MEGLVLPSMRNLEIGVKADRKESSGLEDSPTVIDVIVQGKISAETTLELYEKGNIETTKESVTTFKVLGKILEASTAEPSVEDEMDQDVAQQNSELATKEPPTLKESVGNDIITGAIEMRTTSIEATIEPSTLDSTPMEKQAINQGMKLLAEPGEPSILEDAPVTEIIAQDTKLAGVYVKPFVLEDTLTEGKESVAATAEFCQFDDGPNTEEAQEEASAARTNSQSRLGGPPIEKENMSRETMAAASNVTPKGLKEELLKRKITALDKAPAAAIAEPSQLEDALMEKTIFLQENVLDAASGLENASMRQEVDTEGKSEATTLSPLAQPSRSEGESMENEEIISPEEILPSDIPTTPSRLEDALMEMEVIKLRKMSPAAMAEESHRLKDTAVEKRPTKLEPITLDNMSEACVEVLARKKTAPIKEIARGKVSAVQAAAAPADAESSRSQYELTVKEKSITCRKTSAALLGKLSMLKDRTTKKKIVFNVSTTTAEPSRLKGPLKQLTVTKSKSRKSKSVAASTNVLRFKDSPMEKETVARAIAQGKMSAAAAVAYGCLTASEAEMLLRLIAKARASLRKQQTVSVLTDCEEGKRALAASVEVQHCLPSPPCTPSYSAEFQSQYNDMNQPQPNSNLIDIMSHSMEHEELKFKSRRVDYKNYNNAFLGARYVFECGMKKGRRYHPRMRAKHRTKAYLLACADTPHQMEPYIEPWRFHSSLLRHVLPFINEVSLVLLGGTPPNEKVPWELCYPSKDNPGLQNGANLHPFGDVTSGLLPLVGGMGKQGGLQAPTRKSQEKSSEGYKLKAHPLTIASAASLFHQFFREFEPNVYDRYLIGATCLYIAGKMRDESYKLRDVINVAHATLHRGSSPLDLKEEYWVRRDAIVQAELLVVRVLKFNLQVPSAHKFLLHYLVTLKSWLPRTIWDSTPICQASFSFLQDFYHDPAVLDYKPQLVAISCIYLAMQCYGVDVPGMKETDDSSWFDVFKKERKEDVWNVVELIMDNYNREGSY